MFDWLRRLFKSAQQPSESDSERNGFMSYAAETHAIGHGLYDGMTNLRPTPKTLPNNRDVQKEPHYYKGAYVFGTILHVIVVVVGIATGTATGIL